MKPKLRAVVEIARENEKAGCKFIDMFELKNDTPGFHGPMVHKETGESYQAMMARSEYEYKLRKETDGK